MSSKVLLQRIWRERATAIIRTDDQQVAADAMAAAVAGGFRVIEFTLGCPGAYELVEQFAASDELLVGVGTVLEPEQARRAVAAGARFIVSPVTDERVIHEAIELGALAMPGTFTATEMERAHRAGAHLQKLFPAPPDGPAYVRMLRGPLPFLRIVPTSGVTADNAAEWFEAGVYGVGFVASLFDPALLQARDYDAIRELATRCLTAAHAVARPDTAPDLPQD
jgi:Entner-Doudoroff aldolase